MGTKETVCYDEATLLVDGDECVGMSCMGMSISNYIEARMKNGTLAKKLNKAASPMRSHKN